MPFLDKVFRDKLKTPSEVVSKLTAGFESFAAARKDERATEKAQDAVAKYLGFAKLLLFGDDEHEPTKENAIAFAQEAGRSDLLSLIVKQLGELEFESRKDAAQVFGALVRIRENEERGPGAQYVLNHPEIPTLLFLGYDEPAIALNCGSMLRDCLRDDQIARKMLDGPVFLKFFEKVVVANFEIASDAFSTFKDLLTRHKQVVAQYLQEHYQEFFNAYIKLLQSNNYVVRRQSLKLLGELLLDRSNVKVMLKFVSEPQHLMTMMVLLKDQSRSIQFEAFHVFKVFVANPNKPQAVVDILANNREKLLKYLEDFHTEKEEDEQFKEEKAVIIKTISLLGAPAAAPAPPVAPPPPPPSATAAPATSPMTVTPSAAVQVPVATATGVTATPSEAVAAGPAT
ncbi:hypothetical protein VOLCADRAFT_83428 [Volvox carteri f. nagariensis]|uniref:Uncharacterized protein n=1 Tax=Volvox carteri f. nagariensis TaxID=3068 RepID=D8UBA0_VOLCA|nr:uncharacterized protein VOLCADRAFT_83428 [Volvox carteri f. nagariensis]EFJ42967.1 hypothetical protein VOLCADRAFT_83428 [Volvox carteri f. nagariensis]|eukprot:XP_002956007.1 hypothetical protein VOLCADRAFT_83428 [Volvox carteri f. nagariensis]